MSLSKALKKPGLKKLQPRSSGFWALPTRWLGASHPTLPVRGPEALAGLTFQRVIFKKCMNMYWAAAQGIFWRFYFRSLPGSKVCPGEGISQNGLWKER